MPMHPTQPLEDEVDRGDVGDHQVEVEVKRLLHDLGCNQNASVWSLPVRSE